MQGLNKAFMNDPVRFLGVHPLKVRDRHAADSPFNGIQTNVQPPIFEFDIRPAAIGVELIPFTAHPKTHCFGTQRPISAYWLDYASQRTISVLLNGGANYLFTPCLSGCYIGVSGVSIAHVAGDVTGSRKGTAAMRGLAEAKLGANVTIGFDSNPAAAGQVTFVGVRASGVWSWYAQGHEGFSEGHGTLEPVFDGGQNVIRISDLTYG